MHKHQQKWSYKPYPSNQGCPVDFGEQFAISVVPSDACSTEGSQETGAQVEMCSLKHRMRSRRCFWRIL